MEESAKIDGANDFIVLFRIFIPVSRAAIAVMVLLYAVGQWNRWFNAMIFLRDRKLYPLQLILKEILVQNDTSQITTTIAEQSDMDIFKPLVKYCTVIVSIVPIIMVYPLVQKHFVKGMMIGAVKG
jgi:putative aldouronate transport system permease protein